ncbi:MAG TPA: iron-containing alcohol dehydrogenase [Alcanivoracaceae bacterium]|nr:iron-containing alcohol dehydrogenase [Alcanivoracaceae bacterium]
MNFDFISPGRLLVQQGASQQLPSFAREMQAQSILLISDPGLAALGMLDDVKASFQQQGIALTCFTDVTADPSDTVVLNAVQAAQACSADMIIGFGGGSPMDVAKLVAILHHPANTQALEDLYGIGMVQGSRLPLILVPTTAGTGSEATPIAIITTGATTKSGVVAPQLLPDMAVLDATLTVGLPAAVTAATGVDAMVHAIEAYTSRHKKNPLSDLLAREALSIMSRHIRTATHQGHDLVAREQMLFGAHLAGQAFTNAPVAAVHALAYPLGGHFGVPHGLSNALVLPEVVRFNMPVTRDLYADIAPLLGSEPELDVALSTLIEELELPSTLREVGVAEKDLPMLASDAMLQQRLLTNNPRDVSESDALAIYQQVY